MSVPETSYEAIADGARGPVIAVRFRGECPPGSEGNCFVEAMIEALRSAITQTGASAVILDLTELDGSPGDAIGGLWVPLVDGSRRLRPAAIVASGGTADALRPLLAPSLALGVTGIEQFETRREALEHVEDTPSRPLRELGGDATQRDDTRAGWNPGDIGPVRAPFRHFTLFQVTWMILAGALVGLVLAALF